MPHFQVTIKYPDGRVFDTIDVIAADDEEADALAVDEFINHLLVEVTNLETE